MVMGTLFESSDSAAAGRAPLNGLVLCGGRGTRLGRDKGSLDYHGRPQAQWLLELLQGFCAEVFVSLRADQAAGAVYRDLPAIEDPPDAEGPAAGLLAAWKRSPAAAWLVVAADLPLVDARTLQALVNARDPLADATAFRHPDGTPEPVCAIWEPRARLAVEAAPRASLRRVLEAGRVAYAVAPEPDRLLSVNMPEDEARVRRVLREGGAG